MTLLEDFRSRITVMFGAVVLLTSVLSSALVGSIISSRLAAEQGDALAGLSSNVASVLAEGLQERLQAVELLAASLETRLEAGPNPPRVERVEEALARLQRIGPTFAWLGFTDANGFVQHAVPRLLIGQNVSQRPWFQPASQGPFVGDVHQAKLLAQQLPALASGEPLRFVDFAAPVHAPDGKLLGVVGAHGSWEWAGQVVRGLKSPRAVDQGVQVFILDRKGQVLHRPPSLPPPQAEEPLLPRPSRPGVVEWPDGKRYLTAMAPLVARSAVTDMGWLVVTRQPVDVALDAATQAGYLIIGLGVLAALAAIALAWLLASRLTRPLNEIADAAKRIEAGDLGAQLPQAGGSREMVQLSASLRGMVSSLTRGRQELQRSKDTLELRVAERTEALAHANEELEKLARRDGLTGLANRRMADESVARELARHQRHRHPFSLLLLDIDHFKRINDTHGHESGDEALRAVAQCLVNQCRSSDLVARFGGEEFLVLLPETGSLQGLLVAEKLRAAVAALRLPVIGSFTISVGVAEAAPGVPVTAKLLLNQADLALYAAKAGGRNRVLTYDESMQSTA